MDRPLRNLLSYLDQVGYDFVTPTPATHARVLQRDPARRAGSLRDILGWSLPFLRQEAPAEVVAALEAAGLLRSRGDLLASAVRVSRLHGRLFLHSAYPTEEPDAVFLGPDSYRFADWIAPRIAQLAPRTLVDVGGGGGVGAIVAAAAAPRARLILTDINPLALRFAESNAAHAAVEIETRLTDGLEGIADSPDLIIANPPYMASSRQAYRDGGDLHGGALSVAWASAALERLAAGGRLLLYTGSAILEGGRDVLRERLADVAARHGAAMAYREIDPDVFGEELAGEAYFDVERIAVVGCELAKA